MHETLLSNEVAVGDCEVSRQSIETEHTGPVGVLHQAEDRTIGSGSMRSDNQASSCHNTRQEEEQVMISSSQSEGMLSPVNSKEHSSPVPSLPKVSS